MTVSPIIFGGVGSVIVQEMPLTLQGMVQLMPVAPLSCQAISVIIMVKRG